jgi:hypothetical protein
MIFDGFCDFPLSLWITLWKTPPRHVQTLAVSRLRSTCLLSGQRFDPNEINDLGARPKIVLVRRSSRRNVYDETKSWG